MSELIVFAFNNESGAEQMPARGKPTPLTLFIERSGDLKNNDSDPFNPQRAVIQAVR